MGQFMAFSRSMAFFIFIIPFKVADRKKVGGVVRCFATIMIIKRSTIYSISIKTGTMQSRYEAVGSSRVVETYSCRFNNCLIQ